MITPEVRLAGVPSAAARAVAQAAAREMPFMEMVEAAANPAIAL
jgi:hypothetical protein